MKQLDVHQDEGHGVEENVPVQEVGSELRAGDEAVVKRHAPRRVKRKPVPPHRAVVVRTRGERRGTVTRPETDVVEEVVNPDEERDRAGGAFDEVANV